MIYITFITYNKRVNSTNHTTNSILMTVNLHLQDCGLGIIMANDVINTTKRV